MTSGAKPLLSIDSSRVDESARLAIWPHVALVLEPHTAFEVFHLSFCFFLANSILLLDLANEHVAITRNTFKIIVG
jgi:hypothetical protein